MATNLGSYVRFSLMKEHEGNLEAAFNDLCARYAKLSILLDRSERLASFAYGRVMRPHSSGKIDDVPNPITDDWIATAKEDDHVGRG